MSNLIGLIILLLLISIIPIVIAVNKGFNPIIWFFAASTIIGLIILIFLPSANKVEKGSKEYNKRKKDGNTYGLFIIGFAVLILVAMIGLEN